MKKEQVTGGGKGRADSVQCLIDVDGVQHVVGTDGGGGGDDTGKDVGYTIRTPGASVSRPAVHV